MSQIYIDTGRSQYLGPEFRFVWVIDDVDNVVTDGTVRSPLIEDRVCDRQWQLECCYRYSKSWGAVIPETRLKYKTTHLAPPENMVATVDFLDTEGSICLRNHYNGVPNAKDLNGIQEKGVLFDLPYDKGQHIQDLLYKCRILLRMWNTDVWCQHNEIAFTLSPSTFIEAFKALCLTESLTDVTVACGSEKFPAHKAVLGARSDVFFTMLNTQMAESASSYIKIDDFQPVIVRGLLEYLYSDETRIDPGLASEFISIAEKYNVKGLKQAAELVLAEGMDKENAIANFQLAVLYNCKSLKPFAKQFIVSNKFALVSDPVLKEIAKRSPEEVFDLFATQG